MKVALPSILSVLFVTQLTGYVVAQRKYTCPEDNGQTIITGKKKYELKCGKGIIGPPIGGEEKSCGTLAECAEMCAASAQCLHSTFVEKTKKCALKDQNPGTLFDRAEVSAWFFLENVSNPPPQPEPTQPPPTKPTQPTPGDNSQKPIGGGHNNQGSYNCPVDDKKKYTTNGITYQLLCNTGHAKTHWRSEPCPTLEECADRCSKDKEAFSCDYRVQDKVCYFKKRPAETVPWGDGHTWFPSPCPSVREMHAKKDPEIATIKDLSCPKDDGKIFEGSDGTWFYFQCCTDTNAASVVDQGTASSHEDCVNKCVADKKCKSVAYDSTALVDNCRMYGNGMFSTTKAEGIHHAFVTYPPAKEPELTKSKLCSTECPHADGQLFVSASGENYLMSCNKRHGTKYLKVDRRDSFEACMTACAIMPECRSMDYEPRTQRCFYSNNANQPSISANAFLSAHSLGCAGACSSCKKGCDQTSKEALPADAVSCPDDTGRLLVAGGEEMRLRCSHCWISSAASIKLNSAVKSLAECAKVCGEDESCHGANWIASKGCSMHPKIDSNGAAPTMKRSAECDSITPLTRSLADYKEEDIKD